MIVRIYDKVENVKKKQNLVTSFTIAPQFRQWIRTKVYKLTVLLITDLRVPRWFILHFCLASFGGVGLSPLDTSATN
jgi:hypothetical protein